MRVARDMVWLAMVVTGFTLELLRGVDAYLARPPQEAERLWLVR